MISAQHIITMIFLATMLAVFGCAHERPLTNPMSQQYYISGNHPSATLLVLLPGIHDSISLFEKHGFIDSVRQSGQPCDLVSVDSHYGYYHAGIFVERLHNDVIIPARRTGYSNIKIVGISLGGYGALFYANSHRTEITTLVLLAPWLGDDELVDSIAEANGLENWQPSKIVDEKLVKDIWLQRKESLSSSTDISKIYLGYGTTDKFHKAHSLFATTLPDNQVMTVTGGHNWSTWARIWKQLQAENMLCTASKN